MARIITVLVAAAAGAAITAMWVAPAPRELQLLNCRLIFRPASGSTLVQSIPVYSLQPIQPTVRLNRAVHGRVLLGARIDPDDYILALVAIGRTSNFPPATAWSRHPLAAWAALDGAGQVHRRSRYVSSRPADDQPQAAPIWPGTIHVLETIRMLQRSRPHDGMLWIAQGVVLLETGRTEEGVRAVEEALRRRPWLVPLDRVAPYACRLLGDLGVPAYDAQQGIRDQLWHARHQALPACVMDHLCSLMLRAARAGDDAAFARLAGLANDVRTEARAQQLIAWPADRYGCFQELIDILSARLGVAPLARDMPYARWRFESKNRLAWYLEARAGADLAEAYRLEEILQDRFVAQGCSACRRRSRLLGTAIAPRLASLAVPVLLALLIAGGMLELPFRLSRPQISSEGCDVPTGFYLLAVPLVAGIVTLLFVALRAALAASDHLQQGACLMMAILLCLLMLMIRMASARQPAWYAGAWMLTLAAYTVSVWNIANRRQEAVERLAGEFARGLC
jgi:hypothetical protein